MAQAAIEKLKELIALHKKAYVPLKEQTKQPVYPSSDKTKGLTRPDGKT